MTELISDEELIKVCNRAGFIRSGCTQTWIASIKTAPGEPWTALQSFPSREEADAYLCTLALQRPTLVRVLNVRVSVKALKHQGKA